MSKTKLQNVPEKLIKELIETCKNTKKFLYSEVPEVIKELINLKRVQLTIGALYKLGVTLVISGIGFIVFKFAGAHYQLLGTIIGGLLFIGMIFWSLIAFRSFIDDCNKVLEVFIAPKIFLITFLKDFIKETNKYHE